MHILHVSGDFCNTKVYTNLYQNIAERGIDQTIYCPVRNVESIGRNSFISERTEIVYDYVVKPYHRYVYHIKRRTVFRSLQQKVDLKQIDLCHAATLFTDGGQAYKIYKKYHIPYVVAVRNTDVNEFLNLLPNTWLACKKILLNAEKVFFISKALMEKFSRHRIIRPLLPKIQDKMVFAPNGIDDYYLDNINHQINTSHRVLYVGDFSNNKNVVRLCEAINQLRLMDGYQDVSLTLVGGGNNENDSVHNLIKAQPSVFNYLGKVEDKERMCQIMREHSVFAMPSIFETFGLVYIEALSQQLPIIYTKGQGIDGLFDDTVGVAVNPKSVMEIKNAIQTIFESKGYFSNNSIDFEQFRWKKIAKEYINYYNNIVNQISVKGLKENI